VFDAAAGIGGGACDFASRCRWVALCGAAFDLSRRSHPSRS